MNRYIGIGIFLLIVSSVLFHGAITLGIGKTNSPQPGFVPFLLGLIIAVCSLALIASSVKNSPSALTDKRPLFTTRAVLILCALLLFGLFVEKGGFFVCTFLITISFLKINGIRKWSTVLVIAILTSIGSFLVFNILLRIRLPLGILEP